MAGGVKERWIDTNDDKGTFHLYKTEDVQSVLDELKANSDDVARVRGTTQTSGKKLGTIPNLVAVQWAKEWNVNCYGKEWLALAGKRIKTDPNWRHLRASG